MELKRGISTLKITVSWFVVTKTAVEFLFSAEIAAESNYPTSSCRAAAVIRQQQQPVLQWWATSPSLLLFTRMAMGSCQCSDQASSGKGTGQTHMHKCAGYD